MLNNNSLAFHFFNERWMIENFESNGKHMGKFIFKLGA
jgi:hypothetical protein